MLDPSLWLDQHGDAMFRYALRRLGDRTCAEDAVQEALLGAVKNAASFEGRSEVRTWLIGILRRKVNDQLRRQRSKIEEPTDPLEGLFDKFGEWAAPVGDWHDPESELEKAEFHKCLQACLERLPDSYAEAFLLREAEGFDYPAICDELGLTPTNLSTRLYRARTLLRNCLEENWFGGATKE